MKPLQDNPPERDELSILRHDIRNQLSNIQLSLEQLRYEMPDITPDGIFYLDTIAVSCRKIDMLLADKA